MRSLFRSEPMAKCQLFFQSEAAYQCIVELGELGRVQFEDLNSEVSFFQRRFINDVRRCDEMQTLLSYVEKKISQERLIQLMPEESNIQVPLPKEMIDLESNFEKIAKELQEVDDNVDEMTRNYVQLMEFQQVLRSVDEFFETRSDQSRLFGANSELESTTAATESDKTQTRFSTTVDVAAQLENVAGADSKHPTPTAGSNEHENLCFITGTISVQRFQNFERLLWRVGKGIIFCHQMFINDPLPDVDGKSAQKSVFIVFFPGEQLKQRVKKICAAFRANIYSCPASADERRESAIGVLQRIEDMKHVFNGSRDHRMNVLANAARHLRSWKVQLAKMKSVFHTMNMLNVDVTQKCLIGECWIPKNDLVRVQSALRKGTEAAGCTVPCIMNLVECRDAPPTFYTTNKFTSGFQSIVNAYGVGGYGELNPAPYAIITFPFLFAVMFGDAGHGILMTLIALALIVYEKSLSKVREEVVSTFFGGRFIILLMGVFSIYTGLIYNDIFSKSINMFGTTWLVPVRAGNDAPKDGRIIGLAPETHFSNKSYPFGLDPIWLLSTNKIQFTNSYKMKMAVILGLLQMSFGTFLSLWNHMYFKDRTKFPAPRTPVERVLRRTLNVWAQFVPEVCFLLSLFGYLVFIIVYKWLLYFGNPDTDSADEQLTGAKCSRSLLMLFINMFMPSDGKSGQCYTRPLYSGAPLVEKVILLLAVFSVFWLLLAKPLFLVYLNRLHSCPLPADFVPIVTADELNRNDDGDSASSSSSRRKKSTVSMHTLKGNKGSQAVDLYDEPDDSNLHDGGSEYYEHEPFELGEVVIHQIIHTIEYCLGAVSNTASYLRLWALSLAHAQLSEVLWSMIFGPALFADPGTEGFATSAISAVKIFLFWFPWAFMTISILLVMEGLSAFLHALRLHWVEFMNKFFAGDGYLFAPFSFDEIISELGH